MDIPPAERAPILAEVRRARYGYVLALPLVLLGAAQRRPTEMAAGLFGARSGVYRVGKAYRAGELEGLAEGGEAGQACPPRRLTGLSPALTRSVLAILDGVPRLCGWYRTRWSWATSALQLHRRRGVEVSAEAARRWRPELDWGWERAKLLAQDDEPRRGEKLARIRGAFEQLRAGVALSFADELDMSLLPQVGYQWMPQGVPGEVLTPGTNENRDLAGALDSATGTIAPCVWDRKPTGLFLDLLATPDRASPPPAFSHLCVVADNATIHHAEEVEQWLAAHPRFEPRYLPTSCPGANPLERACGDVPDKCTRTHTRKRVWHLVQDVKRHLHVKGPWPSVLSTLYYTPEVTAAVEAREAAKPSPAEPLQLAA